MRNGEFIVEIDGRKALIDQDSGEVSLLDEKGAVVFRVDIQVAADCGAFDDQGEDQDDQGDRRRPGRGGGRRGH